MASGLESKSGRTELPCTHCGLLVSRKAIRPEEAVYCCYGCSFAHQITGGGSQEDKKVSWALVKLGVSAFFAMNVMGFSLALHASSVYPDYFLKIPVEGRLYDELLRYLLFFLSVPVLFLLGIPLFEKVVQDLRSNRWTSDGLITAGVVASFGYSFYSTAIGKGALYYDIATMVLVFFSLGRYLEARFRYHSFRDLESLYREEVAIVTRIRDNAEETVSASAVCPGDLLALRPGQKIPFDGRVVAGSATLDTAHLSGEPLPVLCSEGEEVFSGSLVTEGFLRIEILRDADHSLMGRLRRLIEEVRVSKPSIQHFADKVSLIFSWVSGILFLVAFTLGFLHGGFREGILRAMAVILIACPCALGAAVPLAFWGTFHKILSKRILFKDLSRIELLSKVRGVFFDKTGTLTEKIPALKEIKVGGSWTEEEALRLSASVADASSHPFSRAIVEEARRRRLAFSQARLVETRTGEGVSAVIGEERVYLGSLEYLRRSGLATAEGGVGLSEPGRVFSASSGGLSVSFSFDERVRGEVPQAIMELEKMKLHTGVLTGDRATPCKDLEKIFGQRWVSGLTPQQKIDWVRQWEKKNGPSLMIGEGLNDAPVVSGVAVSLVMGSGLDQTKDAADFILPDDDLSKVPWLIGISSETMKRIRVNLFWACVYNAVAVPLAVLGYMNPVIAGAAMILSSVFVMSNSFRNRPV